MCNVKRRMGRETSQKMIIAAYLLEVCKKESVVVCRISDDRVLTCQSNFEKQQTAALLPWNTLNDSMYYID